MRVIILSLYSLFQKLRGFKSFGKNSIIKFPYKVWNRNRIEIGKNVFIAENSFLALSTEFNKKHFAPRMIIGDNVCVGSNFFVACIDEVIIEKDVLISDRVFICDHIHGYEDIKTPVINQDLKPGGKVLIKEGSFIGINVVIMPGVTIGRNAVIGASAVVTKDVPDYSVATGNPARVVRQYSKKIKSWQKVTR